MRWMILLVLAGCATSDVVPAGGDTYFVGSRGAMGWSSGPTEKAKALERGAAFCAAMARGFEVVETKESPGGFGRIASAELHFRCVAR